MKPILFNTEMVKAILAGRKTVTRRLVKNPPNNVYAGKCVLGAGLFDEATHMRIVEPQCKIGDILYVRETWAFDTGDDGDEIGTGYFAYRADDLHHPDCKWRPSIHMPKEAARIFLRVKDVRVERLQDITPNQCAAEGIELYSGPLAYRATYYISSFAILWDSTIKPADLAKYGWEANPWVLVIEFERCERPEEDE